LRFSHPGRRTLDINARDSLNINDRLALASRFTPRLPTGASTGRCQPPQPTFSDKHSSKHTGFWLACAIRVVPFFDSQLSSGIDNFSNGICSEGPPSDRAFVARRVSAYDATNPTASAYSCRSAVTGSSCVWQRGLAVSRDRGAPARHRRPCGRLPP
jgi:hypothetical protein